MRDPETIATVLTAAETGHLVFSTLHTSSAAEAIERIVDVFEGTKQKQVLIQLAAVLRDVARSTQNEPNKALEDLRPNLPTDGLLALEKQVLGGIIFDKNFAEIAVKELSSADFQTDARFLANFVLVGAPAPDQYEVVAKEAEFMVESQLEALEDNRVALFRVLEKSLYLLKLHTIKRSLERLTIEIKQAEVSGDANQLKILQGQFASLSEQRLEYEKKLS
jgi:hypothetical protein